jgi:hypothetical protein
MHKKVVFILLSALAAVPALSQDNKTTAGPENVCAEKFKSADGNSDGVLTVTEIPKVQDMPQELTKERILLSRKEFVAACVKVTATQAAEKFDKDAPPSPHSTGTSISPETKGPMQPQGPTGPIETKSGGAPAESPQGQTPPGMQAAPDGSSKTIVDPGTKGPADGAAPKQ